MKIYKKVLSLLIAVMMLISAMPVVTVSAQEAVTLELDTSVAISVPDETEVTLVFTPEESGNYIVYSESQNYCDPYVSVLDQNGDKIASGDDNDALMFKMIVYLDKGRSYSFVVGDWKGDEQEFSVCIKKAANVEKLEVVTQPYRMEYWRWYVDRTLDLSGLELKATMSDGSTAIWEYSEYGDSYIEGHYLDWELFLDSDGTNTVYFYCDNAEAKLELKVIECPVESIEIVNPPQFEFYVTDSYYDEDLDRNLYSYRIPNDTMIRINYNDGTSTVANYNETVDGLKFDYYDYQEIESEEAWKVGENPVYITYAHFLDTFYVTVKEGLVESYTINSNPTYNYIYGDTQYGNKYEDGYYLSPKNMEGFSATLYFRDGTEKTITANDLDFETHTLDDGAEWNIKGSKVTQAGPAAFRLCVYGSYIDFMVNVVESPIESMKVVKDPDKTEYRYEYSPDFSGMQVEVTYTDGTKKVVTANSDTLRYEYDSEHRLCTYLDVDGVPMYIARYGDIYMGIYHRLSMAGCTINYKGIKYISGKAVSSAEITQFDPSGQGMAVEVEYDDGTKETLHYAVLASSEVENAHFGSAMTENGIMFFRIEDNLETHDCYLVYFPLTGRYIRYYPSPDDELKLGDVDGDGKISVLDAAAIQRHLASIAELTDEQAKRADTDGDGRVSILDAAKIQQLLAHIIEKF